MVRFTLPLFLFRWQCSGCQVQQLGLRQGRDTEGGFDPCREAQTWGLRLVRSCRVSRKRPGKVGVESAASAVAHAAAVLLFLAPALFDVLVHGQGTKGFCAGCFHEDRGGVLPGWFAMQHSKVNVAAMLNQRQ